MAKFYLEIIECGVKGATAVIQNEIDIFIHQKTNEAENIVNQFIREDFEQEKLANEEKIKQAELAMRQKEVEIK